MPWATITLQLSQTIAIDHIAPLPNPVRCYSYLFAGAKLMAHAARTVLGRRFCGSNCARLQDWLAVSVAGATKRCGDPIGRHARTQASSDQGRPAAVVNDPLPVPQDDCSFGHRLVAARQVASAT
jgi:hypothetical protein